MTKKDKNGKEYKFLSSPRALSPITPGNGYPTFRYEVEALVDGEKVTLVYADLGNGQIQKIRID